MNLYADMCIEEAKWWVDAIPWLLVKGNLSYITVVCSERRSGHTPLIKRDQRLISKNDRPAVSLIDFGNGKGAVSLVDTYGVTTLRHQIEIGRGFVLTCLTKSNAEEDPICISITPQETMTENLKKVWAYAQGVHTARCTLGDEQEAISVSQFASNIGGLTVDALRNTYLRKFHTVLKMLPLLARVDEKSGLLDS